MLLLFILPATIGAVLVARPLYTVFYGQPDNLALGLFVFALLQTIILSFYTVLAPMIQALFQNRKAIRYFLYGFLAKLVLQLPLVWLFQSYGPLLSTTVGLIVPIVLMYREIRDITGLNPKNLVKRSLLTCILTLVMIVAVTLADLVLCLIFQPSGRISSMIYLVFIGGIGIVAYVGLALRVRLLDRFVGEEKATRIRNKFHVS